MTLGEITRLLDGISPFELQESWDNSGLLIGSKDDTFDHVVVSLDIDEAMLDEVAERTLIITHHPLIFGKLNRLDFSQYPAKFIRKMIKKDIFHIALHTNFDKTHLNHYVAKEVLGLANIEVNDFVCYGEVPEQSLEAYAADLKKRLGLEKVTFTKAGERVRRVALTTGSGASMLKYVDADCFLTGDIKYHDAMEALALNISLIDITHYGSERFFSQILCEILNHNGIKAIIKNSKDPFTIMQEIK